MQGLTTGSTPMSPAHHSIAPWLTTMAAGDVQRLSGIAVPRWLLVQRGCLWVTAAAAAPDTAPREADIWLAEGDSLSLPAGSSWLLQAWPQAELMLVEQAPVRLPPAGLLQNAFGLRPVLGAWAAQARRLVHWVSTSGAPAATHERPVMPRQRFSRARPT